MEAQKNRLWGCTGFHNIRRLVNSDASYKSDENKMEAQHSPHQAPFTTRKLLITNYAAF